MERTEMMNPADIVGRLRAFSGTFDLNGNRVNAEQWITERVNRGNANTMTQTEQYTLKSKLLAALDKGDKVTVLDMFDATRSETIEECAKVAERLYIQANGIGIARAIRELLTK